MSVDRHALSFAHSEARESAPRAAPWTRRYLKRLFKKVADRQQAEFPGLKPDMIIAIHAGIDVYGVRQWLTRRVARERIPLMAVLSGEAESDVRRAHGL